MAELTYSIDEAAEALGISDWLLRRLIQRGEGPPTLRIRRRVLIPKAGLARWVDQHTTPTP